MSGQDEREVLAEVLCSATHDLGLKRMPDHPNPRCRVAACFRCQHYADAILASEWLAEHDKRVRAEGWDAGYLAAEDEAADYCARYGRCLRGGPTNPFRDEGER